MTMHNSRVITRKLAAYEDDEAPGKWGAFLSACPSIRLGIFGVFEHSFRSPVEALMATKAIMDKPESFKLVLNRKYMAIPRILTKEDTIRESQNLMSEFIDLLKQHAKTISSWAEGTARDSTVAYSLRHLRGKKALRRAATKYALMDETDKEKWVKAYIATNFAA